MPNILYRELDFIKGEIEEKLKMKRETVNAKVEKILVHWEKENGEGETPPISKRTLTRIWDEYTEEKVSEGSKDLDTKTIDSLVQLIDNESCWEEYKEIFELFEGEVVFDPQSIVVSKLKEGDEVVVGWKPLYYYDLLYLGDFQFKIQRSHNMTHLEKPFRAEAFLIDFQCPFNFNIFNNTQGYPLPRIVCVGNVRDLDVISKDGVYLHSLDSNSDSISYL